jgi:2-haloacid dehalogenase
VRSGEREYAPLDQLHLENLLEVLTENGVGTTHIPPEALTWLNQSWQRLDPWPDSVPGMKMLKKRFLVGALSNANISLLTQLARYARLPWDVAIGSDVLRAYKPDPAAYRRAAQLLDLPPHSIMLCAAHNHDLAAARAAGYQTAFVCRPAEYGPGQERDLAPTDDWDVIATSLCGLAASVLARPAADRGPCQIP